MNDITLVWILNFGLIWYLLMYRTKPIWELIGSMALFINGLLGVLISDHLITSFVMFITLIIMAKIGFDIAVISGT